MKKKILLIAISLMLLLPLYVNAKVESKNLQEIVKEEGITSQLYGFEENDDQAIIYLFRGNGCGYCKAFINFLNDIYKSYGQYFKVISYEVWYNEDNAQLMKEVGKYLDEPAEGVPYIVIGDKVFAGYATSWDDNIKKNIKDLYDKPVNDRYDVMKKINSNDPNDKKEDYKKKIEEQEKEINTYKTSNEELKEENATLSRTNKRSKLLLIIMGIVTGLVFIALIVLIIIFSAKLKKNKK